MISEKDYGPRAGDMWRWVPEAADDSIAKYIDEAVRSGPDSRPRDVHAKDRWLLLVYAKRSAFAALRQNDPDMVRHAAIAVSMVTEERVGDDRVIWSIVGLICHAQRRVGGRAFADAEG